MRSDEEICALWTQRKGARAPIIARMDTIRRAYEGDFLLPLPELDKTQRAAVANLIQQGIDQLGARIASVKPDVTCPSTVPGQQLAEKRAGQRRQAILGWWDKNDMDVLDLRRARHLIAYAEAPAMIRPGHHFDSGVPSWHIRSPMGTYPGPRPNPDDMTPDDCIFTYQVTLSFLQRRYPDAAAGLEKGENPTQDTLFDVVEYTDREQYAMIVVGRNAPSPTRGYRIDRPSGSPFARIVKVPNRAEVCPVVIPKRSSLEDAMGKFDGMLGMYEAQAKLMALLVIGVQRSVFTKEWLEARPGEMPDVLVEANPEQGITGVVQGGILQPQTLAPSPMASQMISMLDTAQRSQGGLPAELGAQSPTNVRTGKRGDAVISAAIDFPIQEAQTLLSRAKEKENQVAIAISKAYYGSKTVSFYTRSMKGVPKGALTYTPDEIFTTDVNFVDYPHAGSDANQLAVLIGQLVGLELISEDSARKLHPMIDDPAHEKDAVQSQALMKALLGAIAQEVQAGTMAAADVAQIVTALDEDRTTLAAAVQKVQQAKQAQAPPAAPGAVPGMPPGMPPPAPGQPPGQGGAPPAVNGPTPSQDNLAQLLSSLHGPPQQMANA